MRRTPLALTGVRICLLVPVPIRRRFDSVSTRFRVKLPNCDPGPEPIKRTWDYSIVSIRYSNPIPLPEARRMTAWLEYLKSRHAVVSPPADSAAETPARISSFGNPEQEHAAARHGAVACPLLEWVALSVAGADAASFLHGQFTNDAANLAVGAVQYSGYCSPKGRMLANFPLARVKDAEFQLVVPADIALALVHRLRLFVLHAKVVVTPLAESHACIGAAGPAGPANGRPRALAVHREEGLTVMGLPDGRLLAVCAASGARPFWETITRSATPAGSKVWDWLAINAGLPVITAATQDKFVPQMLNWELVGGVNFQKGCYPGQEIVARMQYLGRLKERLYRAHVAAAGAIAPGARLYGAQFGDQACGTIVNAAPAPGGGSDLLAVIRIASAQNGGVRLAPPADGPLLELLPLPYAVPAAQAE
jgi:tRNA-modifying protein YgfZ